MSVGTLSCTDIAANLYQNSLISNLHNTLKEMRQAYLSTAAPPRRNNISNKAKYMTDFEKEAADAWAKQELRVLSGSIRGLSESEEARQDTQDGIIRKRFAQRGLGALGKWAAGGVVAKSDEQILEESKQRELKEHREGILWYLRGKLQECVQFQGTMMEKRLRREMEKKKSMLAKAHVGPMPELGGFPNAVTPQKYNPAVVAEPQFNAEQELSAEQLQMFERQNQDMLKHYQDTLDQVRWVIEFLLRGEETLTLYRNAEKSLVEISELQTELVNNLTTQSAHIEALVADAFQIGDDVGAGNKQLKQASERQSTAQYVFYASCGLSAFLVLWDLII